MDALKFQPKFVTIKYKLIGKEEGKEDERY